MFVNKVPAPGPVVDSRVTRDNKVPAPGPVVVAAGSVWRLLTAGSVSPGETPRPAAPDLGAYETSSPTAARSGRDMSFFIAVQVRWVLQYADVEKAAFYQDRRVDPAWSTFMRRPRLWSEEGATTLGTLIGKEAGARRDLVRAVKGFVGSLEAPCMLYLEGVAVLGGRGFIPNLLKLGFRNASPATRSIALRRRVSSVGAGSNRGLAGRSEWT
jgi:hypothetical protein